MTANANQLAPERAIETDTDLGPLWVEETGHVLTRSLVEHGFWDPIISSTMRLALRPGMTFVDAGANIGYFSVLGSRLVGPEGRVFAIEPDPINLGILRANLERHGCSNVTVVPMAAWTERTELNLYRPEDEGAIARVGMTDATGGQVSAAPLDELIEGPVDYLKVDCELSDHVVVASAERLIDENPSMLVTVEFHPGMSSHTGHTADEILAIYQSMDLVPYRIAETLDGLDPASFAEVATAELPADHDCLDFALSRDLPRRLLRPKRLLERAGDMLEHVPEPIRPKIRRRDRKPP